MELVMKDPIHKAVEAKLSYGSSDPLERITTEQKQNVAVRHLPPPTDLHIALIEMNWCPRCLAWLKDERYCPKCSYDVMEDLVD